MRVLMTTTPYVSHLWGLVPTAWALRSAGHDVRIASLPDITETVVATGLTAMPVGPRINQAALRRRPDDDAVTGLAYLARLSGRLAGLLAHGLFAALEAFRPDLVVSEPMDLAGPMVAQHLGVPAVHQSWGPPFAIKATRMLRHAGVPLRQRFGVAESVPEPDLVLDVCPPSYQDERTRGNRLAAPHQSMRYVPFNGPGAVPAWLHEPAKRPRICIAMGTGDEGLPLIPRLANALAPLGADVIVLARPADVEALAGQAPTARVLEWAPLKVVLAAGCDVLVHHGGPNTALTGLAYGVPQLTAVARDSAGAGDHLVNARLLRTCGAAISLPGTTMTDADVLEAATALLADLSSRSAAGALAAEIAAQPSPADAVKVLEDLVGDAS
jgi:UDP:flavonoid glycosyltransferase YjiC (YdhE family)